MKKVIVLIVFFHSIPLIFSEDFQTVNNNIIDLYNQEQYSQIERCLIYSLDSLTNLYNNQQISSSEYNLEKDFLKTYLVRVVRKYLIIADEYLSSGNKRLACQYITRGNYLWILVLDETNIEMDYIYKKLNS